MSHGKTKTKCFLSGPVTDTPIGRAASLSRTARYSALCYPEDHLTDRRCLPATCRYPKLVCRPPRFRQRQTAQRRHQNKSQPSRRRSKSDYLPAPTRLNRDYSLSAGFSRPVLPRYRRHLSYPKPPDTLKWIAARAYPHHFRIHPSAWRPRGPAGERSYCSRHLSRWKVDSRALFR